MTPGSLRSTEQHSYLIPIKNREAPEIDVGDRLVQVDYKAAQDYSKKANKVHTSQMLLGQKKRGGPLVKTELLPSIERHSVNNSYLHSDSEQRKLPDIKKINSRIADSINQNKFSRIGAGISNLQGTTNQTTLEQSRRERMKQRLEQLYGAKGGYSSSDGTKLSLVQGSRIGSGAANLRLGNSPSAQQLPSALTRHRPPLATHKIKNLAQNASLLDVQKQNYDMYGNPK